VEDESLGTKSLPVAVSGAVWSRIKMSVKMTLRAIRKGKDKDYCPVLFRCMLSRSIIAVDSQPAPAIRHAGRTLIKQKVVPLFYTRDRSGLPKGWVKMAAESMKSICCAFSSHRMLAEYVQKYYMVK
jgi:hypothetical protein